MTVENQHTSNTMVKIAALGVLFAVAVATIISWMHFGSEILLTAASAGLSWCF